MIQFVCPKCSRPMQSRRRWRASRGSVPAAAAVSRSLRQALSPRPSRYKRASPGGECPARTVKAIPARRTTRRQASALPVLLGRLYRDARRRRVVRAGKNFRAWGETAAHRCAGRARGRQRRQIGKNSTKRATHLPSPCRRRGIKFGAGSRLFISAPPSAHSPSVFSLSSAW